MKRVHFSVGQPWPLNTWQQGQNGDMIGHTKTLLQIHSKILLVCNAIPACTVTALILAQSKMCDSFEEARLLPWTIFTATCSILLKYLHFACIPNLKGTPCHKPKLCIFCAQLKVFKHFLKYSAIVVHKLSGKLKYSINKQLFSY